MKTNIEDVLRTFPRLVKEVAYLRTIATAGIGDVIKVGTPVNTEIAHWTGDGTLGRSTNFTWSGTRLTVGSGTQYSWVEPAAGFFAYDLGGGQVEVQPSYILLKADDNSTTKFYVDRNGMQFGSTGGSGYLDFDEAYIRHYDGSGNYVQLQHSGTIGGNYTITYPNVTGTVALNKDVTADVTTTYNFVIGDANNIVTLNNGAAVSAVVPANATVAYPVGTEITVINLGAGTVTLSITTDTLNQNVGGLTMAQYDKRKLVKVAATEWVLGY